MAINRLHTFTRWPQDVERRADLADTDLAFCRVLDKLGIVSPAIEQIRHFACQQWQLAMIERNQ